MQKRGISPLIAIILLIGTTVALAVLVINFSNIFVKNIQEESATKGKLTLSCSFMKIDVRNVCVLGNKVKFNVINDNQNKIESFLFVTKGKFSSDNKINENSLPGFEAKKYQAAFDPNEIGIPIQLDVFPQILVENEVLTCSKTSKDLTNLDLSACFALPNFENGLEDWTYTNQNTEFDIVPDDRGTKGLGAQSNGDNYLFNLKSDSFIIPNDIKFLAFRRITSFMGRGGIVLFELKDINDNTLKVLFTETGSSLSDTLHNIADLRDQEVYFSLEFSGNSVGESLWISELCYQDEFEQCVI